MCDMGSTIGVIGLGRFGSSIAKTLTDLGHQVLAVDTNADNVDDIKDSVTLAKQVEYDMLSLKESGLDECDTAVVAIGHSIQENILVTLMLKELGIKTVVARAVDDLHEKALQKIGATRVINPEKAMGVRLANQLISSDIFDILEISPEYTVQEFKAKKVFIGKTLNELDLRRKHQVAVLAIKRDQHLIILPEAEEVVKRDDVLLAVGKTKNIHRGIHKK
jgi:trk system potassium uptake protein